MLTRVSAPPPLPPPPPPAQQRLGLCNTSGSGTDLPGQSGDVVKTHGPLPQNASLFMGFAFMMTASSESDRLSNKLSSDEEEGRQTHAHTEQLLPRLE